MAKLLDGIWCLVNFLILIHIDIAGLAIFSLFFFFLARLLHL
jgi:hypothetical protein